MPSPPLSSSPQTYDNDQPPSSDDNASSPSTSQNEFSPSQRHAHFRRESLSMAGLRRSKPMAVQPTSPHPVKARRPSFAAIFGSSFGAGTSPQRSQSHESGNPFFRGASVEEGISPTQSVFSGEHTPIWEQQQQSRRRRSSGAPHIRWLGGRSPNTGDEPGVDVRSARDQEAYGHLKGPTKITVVDYSSDPEDEDMNVRVDFPGQRLQSWLDSPAGQRPSVDGRPVGVRWIHVTGLNWDVIKALTLKYQLHPLAVEDALRSGRNPRSKVDYYSTHLYLQILVHHIHAPDRDALARAAEGLAEGETAQAYSYERGADRVHVESTKAPWRWWRPEGRISLPEGVDAVFGPSTDQDEDDVERPLPEKMTVDDDKQTHRLVIDQLSAAYMVPIRRGIISIFMMRDGTLISVSAHELREAVEPIYQRLEDEHSLLRRSGDVSMLAHALLDVAVDLDVEIAQAFEAEILKAESRVLVQAQLEFVRHLFIIQAQITRFRRQLTPLLYACYIMRDQDTTRASAAGALTLPRSARTGSTSTVGPSPYLGTTPGGTPMGHMGGAAGGLHSAAGPNLAGLHGMHGVGALGGAGGGGAAGAGMGAGGSGFMPPSGMPGGELSSLPGATPEGSQWPPRAPTPGRGGTGGSTPSSRTTTPTPGMMHPSGASNGGPPVPGAVTAFFSPLSRVYMNDLIDHLEMVVGSSEQFVNACDHLTDYTFNTLSFQTNASMERLSIVTVIFLPLTFISSYFGMNFTDFDALENSVVYFWKLAAPLTVAFFVVFSFSYLQSAGQTLTRRMAKWKREKDIRNRRGSKAL